VFPFGLVYIFSRHEYKQYFIAFQRKSDERMKCFFNKYPEPVGGYIYVITRGETPGLSTNYITNPDPVEGLNFILVQPPQLRSGLYFYDTQNPALRTGLLLCSIPRQARD